MISDTSTVIPFIEGDLVLLAKPVLAKQSNHTRKNMSSSKIKVDIWRIFDDDKKTISFDPVSGGPRGLPSAICVNNSASEIDLCSVCDTTLMIMENGFPTCSNPECAIIYQNTLDYSPEWRYYGAEDRNSTDPTRCGNPINPLLVESSFGCKILCDSKSSYEMRKIRKWTEWLSIPHKEKSLYEEFQFISIMAQNAGIPKIFIDYAMVVHKDISEQKMFRGMNRDGIKAASIYISCRLNDCPRTAFEIAEIFKLDRSSATTGCSNAVNILQNIERNSESTQRTVLTATSPILFIERFCSKLNIIYELIVLAKFIANKVEKNNIICDNTPQAVTAGIIYLISVYCNLSLTKSNIKSVCGVSEVTINKCFRKLENIRESLIPACIQDKYRESTAGKLG
jgi:transcription initiation factor TFIIB